MKQFIPAPLRLQARLLQRHWRDRRQGHWARFARPSQARLGGAPPGTSPPFQHQWDLVQPVPATQHSAQKIRNLAIALQRLNNVIIQPGQLLSFWHLVGPPTRRRGYGEARGIVGDRLRSDIGGGLCQLSGMLYWLGLQAGMTVIERHPHSQDIYDDQSRYAPLGSDATVVYGYKDLRLANRLAVPLSMRFELESQVRAQAPAQEPSQTPFLRLSLWAPRRLARQEVIFERDVFPQDGFGDGFVSDWEGEFGAELGGRADDAWGSRATGIWVRTLRCGSGQGRVQAPEIVDETFYRQYR
ncbi:MAG: VanW family protein [Synechococcales cyanobacterium RM1_1_8]|nr:VanW family protein [Synechococcales cyanobacterium RM1_1_8]